MQQFPVRTAPNPVKTADYNFQVKLQLVIKLNTKQNITTRKQPSKKKIK